MICTKTELQQITNRVQREAQRRVLVALGVEHAVRPDGSIVVSRTHVEHLLSGGRARVTTSYEEPNWNALAQVAKI